jgi:hypothetical protein
MKRCMMNLEGEVKVCDTEKKLQALKEKQYKDILDFPWLTESSLWLLDWKKVKRMK